MAASVGDRCEGFGARARSDWTGWESDAAAARGGIRPIGSDLGRESLCDPRKQDPVTASAPSVSITLGAAGRAVDDPGACGGPDHPMSG